jgi:hypothetical protein
MNLWKRIKNVFTNELVEKKEEKPEITANSTPPVTRYGKPFFVDFGFMGIPFSVERCYSEDEEDKLLTLIGYWPLHNPSSEPSEWYLPLDDKQHNELVESFNEWRAMWTAEELLERTRNNND